MLFIWWLSLVKEMNFQDATYYSNSYHCVNILKDPTPIYNKYATLIQDIKDLLNPNSIISIVHTLRERYVLAS